MTAITDAVGHGVDQRYLLRRLEQQAAAETNQTSENTGRSPR